MINGNLKIESVETATLKLEPCIHIKIDHPEAELRVWLKYVKIFSRAKPYHLMMDLQSQSTHGLKASEVRELSRALEGMANRLDELNESVMTLTK